MKETVENGEVHWVKLEDHPNASIRLLAYERRGTWVKALSDVDEDIRYRAQEILGQQEVNFINRKREWKRRRSHGNIT